ncbi:MAG: sterol desaturase family protein [Alphaproteobacteria bacterium]|nr:sterol desaturase family protein [Alphaproteobacteria bacterium]
MTFKELVYAFFTYPTILLYLVLSIVFFVLLLAENTLSFYDIFLPIVATIVIYPFAWYVIHRFVLHSRLYKIKYAAATWKRIHFDHHQDPHNLKVLFGAPYTTLPTIFLITGSAGWALGGMVGAYSGIMTGLIITCFYEFCHCIQHLNYQPKWSFLQRIKKLHLAHHFHNEQGNYGITNYLWDRLFNTFYAKSKYVEKSPTVFNIGYTNEEALKYPWVLELSHGVRRDDGPGRYRIKDPINSPQ